MAVPRHRSSYNKRGQRRSHHAYKAPGLSLCPRCNASKLPNRVCSSCGFYRDQRRIEVDAL